MPTTRMWRDGTAIWRADNLCDDGVIWRDRPEDFEHIVPEVCLGQLVGHGEKKGRIGVHVTIKFLDDPMNRLDDFLFISDSIVAEDVDDLVGDRCGELVIGWCRHDLTDEIAQPAFGCVGHDWREKGVVGAHGL